MESSMESVEKIIGENKALFETLLPYLDWLQANEKRSVMNTYGDDGVAENSVQFPVYDSTLMSFVRTCQATGKMDRNYVYTFSRHRLRTVQDELKFIENAQIYQFQDLWNILARYILKGNTKGIVWAEGVTEGVYLHLIRKMQKLIKFWDKNNL